GARSDVGTCVARPVEHVAGIPCGVCDESARLYCNGNGGTPVCTEWGTGAAGERCDYDFGCNAGLVCGAYDPVTGSFSCVPPLADGSGCATSPVCESGICWGGRCRPRCP